MKIILGPASRELAEKTAQLLGVEVLPATSRIFPDGESYVRLEGKAQDEEVVIIQTTSYPQDTRLMQLVFMADAAKRNGARKVTAVIPYLAYARQDKTFLQGEAFSLSVLANIFKIVGIDRLVTVNIHQAKSLERFPFPTKNVSAIPLLAEYFRHKGLEKPFALAPDKGATYIAEEAGRTLGSEHGYLEKHRDRYTGQINIENKVLNIKDKTVIIFDDIISTGGTIVSAAEIARKLGARSVYASCVHALLIGDAQERILKAGVKEIVSTDTVPNQTSKVSVAPLIAKAIVE